MILKFSAAQTATQTHYPYHILLAGYVDHVRSPRTNILYMRPVIVLLCIIIIIVLLYYDYDVRPKSTYGAHTVDKPRGQQRRHRRVWHPYARAADQTHFRAHGFLEPSRGRPWTQQIRGQHRAAAWHTCSQAAGSPDRRASSGGSCSVATVCSAFSMLLRSDSAAPWASLYAVSIFDITCVIGVAGPADPSAPPPPGDSTASASPSGRPSITALMHRSSLSARTRFAQLRCSMAGPALSSCSASAGAPADRPPATWRRGWRGTAGLMARRRR